MTVETTWFCLLWFMMAMYAVLDGFDFGAGILHLFVARNNREREQVLQSIGPVWDGNEVWLIAAGGTMFFAFPALYATSFSGFYLPLMMVLWTLMGRALGIELRHQLKDPLWCSFWDVVFSVSSLLLTILLGAALGNVVRGVSLNTDGVFFAPLWTDFRVGDNTGVLDWYTILIAVTAAAALTHHGALWIDARTDGAVQARSGRIARIVWPVVLTLSILAAVASISVQPNIVAGLKARPWLSVVPVAAFLSLSFTRRLHRRQRSSAAFRASCVYIASMIASASISIFPYVLPARDESLSLTVTAAAAAKPGLKAALYWWVPGMLGVCFYMYFVSYRTMPASQGRVPSKPLGTAGRSSRSGH